MLTVTNNLQYLTQKHHAWYTERLREDIQEKTGEFSTNSPSQSTSTWCEELGKNYWI